MHQGEPQVNVTVQRLFCRNGGIYNHCYKLMSIANKCCNESSLYTQSQVSYKSLLSCSEKRCRRPWLPCTCWGELMIIVVNNFILTAGELGILELHGCKEWQNVWWAITVQAREVDEKGRTTAASLLNTAIWVWTQTMLWLVPDCMIHS